MVCRNTNIEKSLHKLKQEREFHVLYPVNAFSMFYVHLDDFKDDQVWTVVYFRRIIKVYVSEERAKRSDWLIIKKVA